MHDAFVCISLPCRKFLECGGGNGFESNAVLPQLMLQQTAVLTDMKDLALGTHCVVLYDERIGIDSALGYRPIRNQIVSFLGRKEVGVNVTDTGEESKSMSYLVSLDRCEKPTSGSVPVDQRDGG